ncbi:DEAD/DEAH box helicase [Tsuneonella amylolytica]|uniref:DEAD/DEAH box helicase n=1 Tax=Tsuneonella amylolytica TaxID=2338327 RepID=UPI001F37B1E8|nr:DEAD/DEAH box helicase [Tsuneonella amylolytica]
MRDRKTAGQAKAIFNPAHVAAVLAERLATGDVVHAAKDDTEARAIAGLLRAFAPAAHVVTMPATDVLPGETTPASATNIGSRISALRSLAEAQDGTKRPPIALVTTGEALAYSYADPKAYAALPPRIEAGQAVDLATLAEELVAVGYVMDERVDEPGEVGVHEKVLNVFPVDGDLPFRIEAKDGIVAGIRTYDPLDQRTVAELETCEIGRACEPDVPARGVSLLDHLPGAALSLPAKADRRRQSVRALAEDTVGKAGCKTLLSEKRWNGALEEAHRIELPAAGEPVPRFVESADAAEAAEAFLRAETGAGNRIAILAGNRDLRFIAARLPSGIGRVATAGSWAELEKSKAKVTLLAAPAERGFRMDGLVAVAGADLLGGRAERIDAESAANPHADLLGLSDIHIGDVVVHEDHGLGRVLGIEPMPDLDGMGTGGGDAVKLAFAKDTVRLVPVFDLDRVWRYGADADGVALDTLNGTSWTKRRAAIQHEMEDAAGKLVALAEERAGQTAPVLEPETDAYERFCARFPFSETADQHRAIEAVLGDLASGRPMDRLIVGDVGYGKTEVALRAAAAAALAGSQVALAAPTSVLARQHYETFQQRFAKSGVEVAMLSRLTSAADKKRVLAGLKDGSIGIVVGTSAVAGKAVEYADLALVVIDEEQRFGKADKDRLRDLSAGHLLSLSATPIPRTLQSALLGIQDLSILATPPARRQPIRTRIAEFDPQTVRAALMREKVRHGQSFVVVPRIEDLPPIADQLAGIVPELEVIQAHGKLPAAELEDAMVRFAAGDGDVLLATNIIEAGLDVPRANTMIVLHADRFGLAQLHQLRGRVGRGRRRGSIMLATEPGQSLADHTLKRLGTLSAFDSLGAGFAISARDLDMRGAGDLVGADQTGHMKLIGADLYRFLLEQSVRTVRGEPVQDRWAPELTLGIQGCLPGDWIGDDDLRVGLYARAARIQTQDELKALRAELRDRFGVLPSEARAFLRAVQLRILARRASIERIDAGPAAVAFTPRGEGDALAGVEGVTRSGDRFILAEAIDDPIARIARTETVLASVKTGRGR